MIIVTCFLIFKYNIINPEIHLNRNVGEFGILLTARQQSLSKVSVRQLQVSVQHQTDLLVWKMENEIQYKQPVAFVVIFKRWNN